MAQTKVPEARDLKTALLEGADIAIIVAGFVGLEGTALLAEKKARELSERFYWESIKTALCFMDEIRVNKKIGLALKSRPILLRYVSREGFLSCLWNTLNELRIGAMVDLEAVPIKQETVEICEYFSLNPYDIPSSGAAIIVSSEAEEICRLLNEDGIKVRLIGSLNAGSDRILKHRGIKSFLNRPTDNGFFALLNGEDMKCR